MTEWPGERGDPIESDRAAVCCGCGSILAQALAGEAMIVPLMGCVGCGNGYDVVPLIRRRRSANAIHQARWRAAHPEQHAARQRAYRARRQEATG